MNMNMIKHINSNDKHVYQFIVHYINFTSQELIKDIEKPEEKKV